MTTGTGIWVEYNGLRRTAAALGEQGGHDDDRELVAALDKLPSGTSRQQVWASLNAARVAGDAARAALRDTVDRTIALGRALDQAADRYTSADARAAARYTELWPR
jgi:hypothetical protein